MFVAMCLKREIKNKCDGYVESPDMHILKSEI